LGHRRRLGASGGEYGSDDRESEGKRTKVDRESAKGVGSKVVGSQGEECGSALLARIVFDKDNLEGWSNTVQSVVMLRVRE
jgi:hypothetical protein